MSIPAGRAGAAGEARLILVDKCASLLRQGSTAGGRRPERRMGSQNSRNEPTMSFGINKSPGRHESEVGSQGPGAKSAIERASFPERQHAESQRLGATNRAKDSKLEKRSHNLLWNQYGPSGNEPTGARLMRLLGNRLDGANYQTSAAGTGPGWERDIQSVRAGNAGPQRVHYCGLERETSSAIAPWRGDGGAKGELSLPEA